MTINITELRRLAQAATPGPDGVSLSWIKLLQDFQQGANPAAINELLDRLEAAEKAVTEAYQRGYATGQEEIEKERDALRALVVMRFDHDYPPQFTQGHDLHELTEPVTAEHCRWFVAEIERLRTACDALRAKIEAAENDAAHQKALAASALRVAEGWERKCGELRAEVIYWKEQKEPGAAGWRALARILQAKIDAMEKQEPVVEVQWAAGIPNGILDFISTDDYLPKLGDKLYARPGAKGE